MNRILAQALLAYLEHPGEATVVAVTVAAILIAAAAAPRRSR